MWKLGELRDVYPNLVTASDLLPTMSGMPLLQGNITQTDLNLIDRHLQHLEGRGYLKMGPAMVNSGERWIRLTAQGEIFLQPELADFGDRPTAIQVVNHFITKIETSSSPPEEKATWVYKLRSATADRATDLLAKVIVEAGAKFLGS